MLRPVVLVLSIVSQLQDVFGQFHNHPALPLGYPCKAVRRQEPMGELVHCFHNVTCVESRYSRFDGRCNNKRLPKQGAAGTDFKYLLPKREIEPPGPDMRFFLSHHGRELPNARLVSNKIHGRAADAEDTDMSLMVMQFGQFLDHDFTLTAETEFCTDCGAEDLLCCDFYLELNNYTRDQRPGACWPIPVPVDDETFSGPNGPRCLEFKRSQKSSCRSERHGGGNDEIFNEITHYIDASNVYGSTAKILNSLKHGTQGRLKGHHQGKSFLLPDEDDIEAVVEEETCELPRSLEDAPNFAAGDTRSNENPGLQSMHTVWAREHNRLARQIKALTPHKHDEEIMLEARRYVIAQMQNVVYNEFLAEVLSEATLERYNLKVDAVSQYDENVEATIFAEFSTATFRFGHSLISSLIEFYKEVGQTLVKQQEALDDNFFNTTLVRQDQQLGLIFKGITSQSAKKLDATLTSSVRQKLFKASGDQFGNDLAALNIQRGRDHAIGGYGIARVFCGLGRMPEDFEDARPIQMSEAAWSSLAEVYTKPEDIELYPGGLSENPEPGGRMGPTFACIMGRQFKNLKEGDRFFFTHDNVDEGIKFCPGDLAKLRRRTLRDIICENTDITDLARSAFRIPSASNPLVSCSEVNSLNPDDLCLFNATRAASSLTAPGFRATTNSGNVKREVLVLAGGFDGTSLLTSVEVYSPEGTCNFVLEPLPEATYGLSLHFMSGNLYACGGHRKGKKCYRHVATESIGWIEDSNLKLNSPRFMAAQAVSQNGVVILSGGWDSAASLEYVDQFGKDWNNVDGISRVRHCLVALNGERLVAIGGFKNGQKVELYDPAQEAWLDLQDIANYNDKHSCLLLQSSEEENERILVVGESANSVIYHVGNGTTETVGRTYFSRAFGALVTCDGRILVIGGDYHQKVVEEFNLQTKMFTVVPSKLLKGRSRFGSTTAPKKYFIDRGYNCT